MSGLLQANLILLPFSVYPRMALQYNLKPEVLYISWDSR